MEFIEKGVTVDNIGAGNLWAFPDRRFKTQIPLVGAKEDGQDGACVQISAASVFNEATRSFTQIRTQKEILAQLNMKPNDVVKLEPEESGRILYLIRKHSEHTVDEPEITPEEALDYFKKLLGE